MTKEEILRLVKRRSLDADFLLHNVDWLSCLKAAGQSTVSFTFYNDMVDINDLDRESTLLVIKKLGGKWRKSTYERLLCYETTHPEWGQIRLWGVELPPTCRLVKEEVKIPYQPAVEEHTIARYKVECGPSDEGASEPKPK